MGNMSTEAAPKERLAYSTFRNGRSYKAGEYTYHDSFADQITLPNGQIYLTGRASVNSLMAKDLGWPVKLVTIQGCCIAVNAIERALDGFPVWIDGYDAADILATLCSDDGFSKLLKSEYGGRSE